MEGVLCFWCNCMCRTDEARYFDHAFEDANVTGWECEACQTHNAERYEAMRKRLWELCGLHKKANEGGPP